MTTDLNVQPLREALARFDESAPRRALLWDQAQHDGHVRTAEHLDTVALLDVRNAYWQATRDRNSYAACMLVHVNDARRLVAYVDGLQA